MTLPVGFSGWSDDEVLTFLRGYLSALADEATDKARRETTRAQVLMKLRDALDLGGFDALDGALEASARDVDDEHQAIVEMLQAVNRRHKEQG